MIHRHCPFDYCTSEPTSLDLNNLNNQCEHSHSGVLCGGCKNGLSLVLETSQCLHCSNVYLLLSIPFALTGLILVCLLIVYNLTVSVATINGLIFYANIIRANQSVFFPGETSNPYTSVLTTFIAWVNLDLGIQTCFWDKMDAYGKTWLQFIFPVYIWAIMMAIIVLSHYFTTAARLSGRNAVLVLATLFLLSYAKILRVIATILSFTTLHYTDETQIAVWLYDGNVQHLEGKHIPLFLVTLFFLVGLSVPYTLVIVFAQCLQKSKARVFFWVRKFKPLFDAHTGPYKDNHRYWTGLLLFLRAILFFIFFLNYLGDPAINLVAIITAVFSLTILQMWIGGAYKDIRLSMLEHSFLLNLGITSAATLYNRLSGGNQVALGCVSVTIALVTFAWILLYHTVVRLKNSRCLKARPPPAPVAMVNVIDPEESSDEEVPCQPEHQPLVLRFETVNGLREPVLELWDEDNERDANQT